MAPDLPEIPDDAAHRATRELYEELKAAGVRQQRGRRERRRPILVFARRVGPVVAAAVLASSVVAVATRDHAGEGGALHADPGPPSRETTQGRQLALALSPDPVDPADHGFPWGLRLRHVGSELCAVAGRVDSNGRIGLLQSGRFLPYADDVNGSSCSDVDAHHALVVVRTYGSGSGTRRTLLFGAVDRTVTSLRLQRPSGPSRPVSIADDGSFILALNGDNALHDATLIVAGGATTTQRPLGPDAAG